MSKNDELVQYLLVNEDLLPLMSPGKIAAQCSHAAAIIAVRMVLGGRMTGETNPEIPSHLLLRSDSAEQRHQDFAAWFGHSMKKIVLRAPQAKLEALEHEGFFAIHDAGHTDVPPDSLTVVGLPPMTRREAGKHVGGLPTLR